MYQLEELSRKEQYDFGVYLKETIVAYIDDQNYTKAEYTLNCICKGDTGTI